MMAEGPTQVLHESTRGYHCTTCNEPFIHGHGYHPGYDSGDLDVAVPMEMGDPDDLVEEYGVLWYPSPVANDNTVDSCANDVEVMAVDDDIVERFECELCGNMIVKPAPDDSFVGYILYTCNQCGMTYSSGDSTPITVPIPSSAQRRTIQQHNDNRPITVPIPLSAQRANMRPKRKYNKKAQVCEAVSKTLKFQCKLCKEVFESLSALEWHELKYIGGLRYPCVDKKCNRILHSKEDLEKHKPSHFAFKCLACDLRFEARTLLTQHEKTHTEPRSFRCDICKVSFFRHFELVRHKQTSRHIAKKAATKQFHCNMCFARFETESELEKHASEHEKDQVTLIDNTLNQHKCEDCRKTFKTSGDLRFHIEKFHPFKCTICAKRFATRGELEVHANSHESINIYTCVLCGKICSRKQRYVEHMRIHSHEKPFRCTVCAVSFNTVQDLRAHMKKLHMHRGQNGCYVCTICKFVSPNLPEFYAHVSVHCDKVQRPCSHCDDKFVWKDELNNHLFIIHGIRPQPTEPNGPQTKSVKLSTPEPIEIDFTCSYCKESFTSQKELDQHKSTHSSSLSENHPVLRSIIDKKEAASTVVKQKNNVAATAEVDHTKSKVECGVCKRTFEDEKLLDSHKKVHFGANPFKCDICGVVFLTHKPLISHMRMHQVLKRAVDEGNTATNQCNICGTLAKSVSALIQHISVFHSLQPYRCITCNVRITNRVDLEMHLKLGHNIKSKKVAKSSGEAPNVPTEYTVKSEGVSDSTAQADNPTKVVETGKVLEWPTCMVIVDGEKELVAHKKLHHSSEKTTSHPKSESPISGICVTVNSEEQLIVQQTKSEQPVELCADRLWMGKVTGYLSSRTRKDAASADANYCAFQCLVCRSNFKNIDQLKDDLKTHSGTSKPVTDEQLRILYECFCKKSVKSEKELINHLKTHVLDQKLKYHWKTKISAYGATTHKCIVCNAMLKTQAEFLAHIETHEGMLKCAKCRQIFVNIKHLYLHTTKCSRDVEEASKCQVCGANVRSKKGRKKHMFDHVTGLEKFVILLCTRCSDVTSTHEAMMAHITTHKLTNNESGGLTFMYKCTKCDAILMCPESLWNHMESHEDARSVMSAIVASCKNTSEEVVPTKSEGKDSSAVDALSTSETSLTNETKNTGEKVSTGCKRKASSADNAPSTSGPNFTKKNKEWFANLQKEAEQIQQQNFISIPQKPKTSTPARAQKPRDQTVLRLPCTFCPTYSNDNVSLATHLVSAHNVVQTDNGHDCCTCNRTIRNKRYLKEHMKLHDFGLYPCTECTERFSTKTQLEKHMLAHARMQLDSFAKSMALRNSSSSAQNGANPSTVSLLSSLLKCFFCEQMFSSKDSLVSHELDDHNVVSTDVGYGCKTCGMKIPSTEKLQEHMKIHGFKPFPCAKCSEAYTCKEGLQHHMHSHVNNLGSLLQSVGSYRSKGRNFMKSVTCFFCEHVLVNHLDLKQHLLSAHNVTQTETTFACNTCMWVIPTVQYLQEHMRVHDIKPFPCAQCNNRYGYLWSLNAHRMRHSLAKKADEGQVLQASDKKLPANDNTSSLELATESATPLLTEDNTTSSKLAQGSAMPLLANNNTTLFKLAQEATPMKVAVNQFITHPCETCGELFTFRNEGAKLEHLRNCATKVGQLLSNSQTVLKGEAPSLGAQNQFITHKCEDSGKIYIFLNEETKAEHLGDCASKKKPATAVNSFLPNPILWSTPEGVQVNVVTVQQCEFCAQIFRDEPSLQEHVRTIHPDKDNTS